MFYSDDPLRDFAMYEEEQDRYLKQLPVCSDCGEHIQEDYCYEINGEYICEECMKSYRKAVEDIVC